MITVASPASAEQVTLTDVTGRRVSVSVPVRKVLLGEGRQIHVVAVLDRDAPFSRVVGWGDDLEKADPDSYQAYVERYPQAAQLPKFRGVAEGGFDDSGYRRCPLLLGPWRGYYRRPGFHDGSEDWICRPSEIRLRNHNRPPA